MVLLLPLNMSMICDSSRSLLVVAWLLVCAGGVMTELFMEVTAVGVSAFILDGVEVELDTLRTRLSGSCGTFGGAWGGGGGGGCCEDGFDPESANRSC